MANKVIFLTAGTSWTVPSDWNSSSNSIECIGGGGSSGTNSGYVVGGGGGAYSKITNLALTPGNTVSYSVGAGGLASGTGIGGNTWFNGTTFSSNSVAAEGAQYDIGGRSSSGRGTTKYSGGNGGFTSSSPYHAGGGGAAGKNSAGTAGSVATGGAAGGGAAGNTAGTEYTATNTWTGSAYTNTTPTGGAGGGADWSSTSKLYGGGAGTDGTTYQNGAKGVIIVTYAVATASVSLSSTEALDTSSTTITSETLSNLSATEGLDTSVTSVVASHDVTFSVSEALDTIFLATNNGNGFVGFNVTETADTASASVTCVNQTSFAVSEQKDTLAVSVSNATSLSFGLTESKDTAAATAIQYNPNVALVSTEAKDTVSLGLYNEGAVANLITDLNSYLESVATTYRNQDNTTPILDTYVKSPAPPKDPNSQYVYNEQQYSSLEKSLRKHHDKILDVNDTARALYENSINTQLTTSSALVEVIETLDSKVNVNNTTNQASINNIQKAFADSESATATKLTALEAKVDSGDATNQALIVNEAKTRATKLDALSSQVSALGASIKTTQSDSRALVKTEQQARADALSSEANSRVALQSFVGWDGGSYSSSIVQTMGTKVSKTDGASYEWSVKGTIDGTTGGLRLQGAKRLNPTTGVLETTTDLIIDANTTINGSLVVNGTITGTKIGTGSNGVATGNIVDNAVSGIASGTSPGGVAQATITGISGSSFLILGSIDGLVTYNTSSVTMVLSVVANGTTVGYWSSPVVTLYGVNPVLTTTGYISTSASSFSATGPYPMWGFGGNGYILPRTMQAQFSVTSNNTTHYVFCGIFDGSTQLTVPTSVAVWQFKK